MCRVLRLRGPLIQPPTAPESTQGRARHPRPAERGALPVALLIPRVAEPEPPTRRTLVVWLPSPLEGHRNEAPLNLKTTLGECAERRTRRYAPTETSTKASPMMANLGAFSVASIASDIGVTGEC